MLKEFYTNIDRFGNKLLYRGYDANGKRVQKRVPYKPTLYLESKNNATKWQSIYGENVEPITFSSMYETKNTFLLLFKKFFLMKFPLTEN